MARAASRTRTVPPALEKKPARRGLPARKEPPARKGLPAVLKLKGRGRKAAPGKAAPGKPEPAAPPTAPAAPAPPKGPRPLPLLIRLPVMLVAFAVMVGFAVFLARMTLEPSPASVPFVHSNLRPGHSLRAYLEQPAARDAVKQIGGNLLLGAPFGILVPVLAPKARGMLKVLLLTGITMLLVELAQGALITGRAFDIDDVILNTSGALLGYLLLGRRLGRAVHARR